MHELPVVRELFAAVIRAAMQNGARRVKKIRLAVGSASGMDEGSLRHYFSECARESIAAGAELEFQFPLARGSCRECGWSGDLYEPQDGCPRCARPYLTLQAGREISVGDIEIER